MRNHERSTHSVVVCGPNLRDQSKGTFHVHAEGCSDLVRHRSREPEYGHGWAIEVDSREEIVRAIYEDQINEQEGPVDWHDYDDLHVFPCVTGLPNEVEHEVEHDDDSTDDGSGEEPDPEPVPESSCPTCGGPGEPLGSLGQLCWCRCRDCGLDFNVRPEVDDISEVTS